MYFNNHLNLIDQGFNIVKIGHWTTWKVTQLGKEGKREMGREKKENNF